MSTITALTTQVYSVYIRATPEQVWDAITQPEWTARYFYGARIEVGPEWRKVYSPDGGDDWGSTSVTEFDPPRRLVHEWKSSYNPELAAEEPSRVTTRAASSSTRRCFITPKRVISGSSTSSSPSVRPSRSKSWSRR